MCDQPLMTMVVAPGVAVAPPATQSVSGVGTPSAVRSVARTFVNDVVEVGSTAGSPVTDWLYSRQSPRPVVPGGFVAPFWVSVALKLSTSPALTNTGLVAAT